MYSFYNTIIRNRNTNTNTNIDINNVIDKPIFGNKPFILQFKYIGTSDFDFSYILPINNDGEGFKNISFTTTPTNPKYLENVILEIHWNFQDNEAQTINSGISFSNIDVLNWYNNNTSELRIIQWSDIPLSRGNAFPFGGQFKGLKTTLLEFTATDSPTILSNTYLNECFMNCSKFNSNLNNFDTLNVINMRSMFENATNFNQPIETWNTSNVTTMETMFKNATSFNQTINFNTINVITMEGMFEGASKFNNGDVNNSASKPIDFNVTNVINMSFMFKNTINFNQELLFFRISFPIPLYAPINVITIEEMFNNAILYNNGDINNNGLKPMNFSFMSNLENLARTFKNALVFNQNIYMVLENAKTMEEMFCDAIIFNNGDIGNNGYFGAQYFMPKIETLKGLFKNAVSFNQSFRTAGTQLLLTTEEMFSGAVIYNDGIIGTPAFSESIFFQVDSILNMKEMFKNCLNFNLTLQFVTSDIGSFKITNTEGMFDGAIIFNNGSINNDGLNPISWDAPLLKNIKNMFRNATQFNQKFELNDSFEIINMRGLFNGCSNFNNGSTNNDSLNEINYNTNFVKDMSNMFSFCALFNQTINFTNTSNVTTMEEMFYQANIFNNGNINNNIANKPINFNTINVINMKRMFAFTNQFNQIINFSNTINVNTMEEMFYNATIFNNGNETNPISWDTSNVITMKKMFAFASNFNQKLLFNISKITDMSSMFESASSFNSIVTYDISNNYWNTSNIYNRNALNSMFFNASSFNNGEGFNGITSPMNWIIRFIGVPTNFSVGSILTFGPPPDGNSPGLTDGKNFLVDDNITPPPGIIDLGLGD
jgi:surface protein